MAETFCASPRRLVTFRATSFLHPNRRDHPALSAIFDTILQINQLLIVGVNGEPGFRFNPPVMRRKKSCRDIKPNGVW